MSNEFAWWRGASGSYWLHSSYPVNAGFRQRRAGSYLIVRTEEDGSQTPLFAGASEDVADTWREHSESGLLEEAESLGADRVHLHFVSWTANQRSYVANDIARHHRPLMNEAAGLAAARKQRAKGNGRNI